MTPVLSIKQDIYPYIVCSSGYPGAHGNYTVHRNSNYVIRHTLNVTPTLNLRPSKHIIAYQRRRLPVVIRPLSTSCLARQPNRFDPCSRHHYSTASPIDPSGRSSPPTVNRPHQRHEQSASSSSTSLEQTSHSHSTQYNSRSLLHSALSLCIITLSPHYVRLSLCCGQPLTLMASPRLCRFRCLPHWIFITRMAKGRQ